MERSTRKKKLQPQHRRRTYDSRTVPSLTLSGVWLEQTGFKVGQQVEIIVKNKKLTIKPLS